MKPLPNFVFSAIAAAVLIPASALAQDAKNQGYLIDSSGAIVTSGSGLCWHTSEWTPARAVEPCDPTIQPVVVAAAPMPPAAVIAPATPAPLPAPAAVAPAPQKISFSADALFAFDKSELKPESRSMLDDLVRQLKSTNYDVVLVTGHTDRIGSAQYNQKLSVRRASAVKDYLQSQAIAVERIQASGRGESEPVTAAGTCQGATSAKVIACLQPDRRVDVEVQGTRAQ